jgi:hypothetical protein
MNMAIEKSEFKPQYFDRKDSANNPTAKTIRDLRRLKDLIEQYDSKGLNTYESNEKQTLIERYHMEHYEAYNLEFVKE